MKNLPDIVTCFLFLSFPCLLGLSVEPNNTTGGSNLNFFPVCADYRNTARRYEYSVITIPPTRTSEIVYSYPESSIRLPTKSGQRMRCDVQSCKVRRLQWEFPEVEMGQTSPRNFLNGLEEGNAVPHQISYFTSVGVFYDNLTATYYRPDGDYCIESYSDVGIMLQICPLEAVQSGKKSQAPLIIPKCCALEEVLIYWKMSCSRLPQANGITPWRPPVYEYKADYPPQEPLIPQHNIRFKMARMPTSCTILPVTVRWWNGAVVKHPIDPIVRNEDSVHLVTPSPHDPPGEVQLSVLYSAKRQWNLYNAEAFCVDGFFVRDPAQPGKTYSGVPENFVIYYCSDPSTDEAPDNVKAETVSGVYVGISVAALVFLLSTVVVYASLWEKHNLHGLTIFSYSLATFLSYFFLAIAHIVRLLDDPSIVGLFHRGWFCYGVAVLAHWFYLASYMWLTVMNVDLWLTFKVVRAVRSDLKDWKKFWGYSAVAWGFTLSLIIAFIVLDNKYRDPKTLVPVPDYATATCFVSPEFRGLYVYTPMAILMGINFMLIGMTLGIFIQARRQSSKKLRRGHTNASRYSARLFGKLLVIMGGTSIVDFLTWYYNNNGNKPWIIVVLECIAYLTPAFLFILFCFNDRILGLARETYPNFTGKLHPLLRHFEETKRRQQKSETSTASKQTHMSMLSTSGMDSS